MGWDRGRVAWEITKVEQTSGIDPLGTTALRVLTCLYTGSSPAGRQKPQVLGAGVGRRPVPSWILSGCPGLWLLAQGRHFSESLLESKEQRASHQAEKGEGRV